MRAFWGTPVETQARASPRHSIEGSPKNNIYRHHSWIIKHWHSILNTLIHRANSCFCVFFVCVCSGLERGVERRAVCVCWPWVSQAVRNIQLHTELLNKWRIVRLLSSLYMTEIRVIHRWQYLVIDVAVLRGIQRGCMDDCFPCLVLVCRWELAMDVLHPDVLSLSCSCFLEGLHEDPDPDSYPSIQIPRDS